MAVKRIVTARPDPGGAYDIYEVRPLAGAIGGTPQKRPPFSGPALVAVDEVAGAGYGQGFAVDVGTGYAHVYVRSAGEETGQPVTQPGSQTVTQPTDGTTPGQGSVLQPNRGAGFTVGDQETVVDEERGGILTAAAGALEVLRFLGGAILGRLVKDWGKMPANSNPLQVYEAAERAESDMVGVGRLLQGIPGSQEGVVWMGRQREGNWFVPVEYLPDPKITAQLAPLVIDPNGIYPEGILGAHDVNAPRGSSGPTMEYGAIGAVIGVPPTRPQVVQVRRCGKGMQLAIDGGCYPKKMLTAATRANKSKKAVVSYRDGSYIRKGRSARRKIEDLAEDIRHDEVHHRATHRHRHTHRRRRR